MIDIKYCRGCYCNYYNSKATSGSSDGMCWNRKSGKIVWRIPIGIDEPPPYKNKKKVRVPSCWRGGGSNRIIMVKPEVITKDGYWKS
jgi:hypothetical protein